MNKKMYEAPELRWDEIMIERGFAGTGGDQSWTENPDQPEGGYEW